MTIENREQVLEIVNVAHDKLGSFYPETPVYQNTPAWVEKRRLLLADLSLHLAQDALKGDSIDVAALRNHLFAVLRISGELFPKEHFTEVAGLIDKHETGVSAD